MTEEKLKRCNELAKQIQDTRDYIKMAKSTQHDNVTIRPMYVDLNWYDTKLKIPESLFRIIGKLILNEHQQKLIDLEKEFWNL